MQIMKINRFVTLAALAVIVVGAMGFAATTRSFAQGGQPPAATDQVQDCSAQADDDASEGAAAGPDTDNVEEQCGQQVEDGQKDGDESQEAPGEADTGAQEPALSSSITIDQAQSEGLSETDEEAALQDKALITAADAESAALASNPGASVVKTELDNENGALVYSVELDSGVDVKVDAGNGQVLFADSSPDGAE